MNWGDQASIPVWWTVDDPYVGTMEWKASIAKRTRSHRFMGLIRQRAMGSDLKLAAQQARFSIDFHLFACFGTDLGLCCDVQAEALTNTRERRRLVRRARRQMMASARESAAEREALYAKLKKTMKTLQLDLSDQIQSQLDAEAAADGFGLHFAFKMLIF